MAVDQPTADAQLKALGDLNHTTAHFETRVAAAANAGALTPKVIEDAQHELASRAATRLVNKLSSADGHTHEQKRL